MDSWDSCHRSLCVLVSCSTCDSIAVAWLGCAEKGVRAARFNVPAKGGRDARFDSAVGSLLQTFLDGAGLDGLDGGRPMGTITEISTSRRRRWQCGQKASSR
mmetsp:Transcript_138949/g.259097  ORF Transcript_138949/g.259097 Transcript_138949/m.259097 type:complete len:102 (+) Transcript_138949:131-436(+)